MKPSILPFNYQSSEYFDDLVITFYEITFLKNFGTFRKNDFFKIAEIDLREGLISAWNGESNVVPIYQTKFTLNEFS